jgi:hypothetical protein
MILKRSEDETCCKNCKVANVFWVKDEKTSSSILSLSWIYDASSQHFEEEGSLKKKGVACLVSIFFNNVDFWRISK